MVESTIPRLDFFRESTLSTNSNRHFAFHMGQNDVQPKTTVSFVNSIASTYM